MCGVGDFTASVTERHRSTVIRLRSWKCYDAMIAHSLRVFIISLLFIILYYYSFFIQRRYVGKSDLRHSDLLLQRTCVKADVRAFPSAKPSVLQSHGLNVNECSTALISERWYRC